MTQETLSAPKKSQASAPTIPKELLEDLRTMIDKTRQSIASTVNAGLTSLYWRIGHRIHKETLKDERAEYGQKIVVTLSRQCAIGMSLY